MHRFGLAGRQRDPHRRARRKAGSLAGRQTVENVVDENGVGGPVLLDGVFELSLPTASARRECRKLLVESVDRFGVGLQVMPGLLPRIFLSG